MSAPGFTARFVVPVLLAPALNPINTTIIAVALVPIAEATGVDASATVWLIAVLYLASAVGQPTMGRLADLVGPKRIFLVGLAITAVAGLVPLFAPTFLGALIARLGIGIGSSAAYPSAMSLIGDQSTRLARPVPPALLSGLSASSLVTSAIGPVIGGVLLEVWGWQSVFLVNTPYALAVIAMGAAWLPADRTRPAAASIRPRAKLDILGMGLFAGAVTALLLWLLDLAAGRHWLAAVTVAALGALGAWELRHPAPFLDVRELVRNAALTRTYLRLFLVSACVFLVVYGLTPWLQAEGGQSSLASGLLQLPAAVTAGIAVAVVARTTRVRAPLLVAAASTAAVGVLLAFTTAATPLWIIVCAIALVGVPRGLASVSNQAALYAQAPRDQLGASAGLSRAAVQIAAISATALIGPVFGPAPTDGALHVIGWTIAALGATAVVLTAVDRSLRR